MKAYRFNYLLDSLRLIRGIFFESSGRPHKDPFIGTYPPRILQRKYLFQFDSIKNESGNYLYDYSSYQPYLSSQPILIEHLPHQYAKSAFQHLMQQKENRIKQITTLLEKFDIPVEPSSSCWAAIGNWVNKHVEANLEPNYLATKKTIIVKNELILRPIWYSIAIDLALLFGEHLIRQNPEGNWQHSGDMNYLKSKQSPWLLYGPTPTNDRWLSTPSFVQPLDSIIGGVRKVLAEKIEGKMSNHSKEFGWGLMFALSIKKPPENDSLKLPSDDRVINFISMQDEFKQSDKSYSKEDIAKSLDIFLDSYYKDLQQLPSLHDLNYLDNNIAPLPDWVKKYSQSV